MYVHWDFTIVFNHPQESNTYTVGGTSRVDRDTISSSTKTISNVVTVEFQSFGKEISGGGDCVKVRLGVGASILSV